MITREQAVLLRKLIEKMSADLTDDIAYTAPQLFPQWTLKQYTTGDRVQYQGALYKCIQAHTAQSDWTPDVVPALWTVVSVEEWPEWTMPTGAQDSYKMGDKVSHNGKHWESITDNNVWEPGVYGWQEVN